MPIDAVHATFLAAARALLGDGNVLTADLDAYTTDWRGKFHGRALAVLRPGSTAEVAAVVKLCAAHGVRIVPQGGNTGMCGAATSDASGTQVVVTLGRMSRIRAIDTANDTMTVDAGCVLATLQDAAADAGRLFPLSLGAEGSCQIGGNIATNAGGVQVLRYGNTRDLVLGLEVVLADGQVLDLLRALRKDNTGYDLKQLFIGSEGTLGIVTAATLKLFPAPRASAVAFAAVQSPERALDLLQSMRADLGERFTAFELLSLDVVRLVQRWFAASPRPFDADHPWYVLMEARDGGSDEALAALFQAALERALESGTIDDVAVAASRAQAEALWQLRDSVSEAQQRDGATIKHDISVPVSSVPAFVAEAMPLLRAAYPGIRPFVFGHLGDGNLHFNMSRPEGWDNAAWEAETDAVNLIVHDTVARHAGSISAEHGIGQLKRHEVGLYKSALEIDVMQRVKRALDPQRLMNPGKLLPD